MLKSHFKETKTIEKILKTKKGQHTMFCECCLTPNPYMQEDCGYTQCCNEPTVSGRDALVLAKQNDIMNSLGMKFRVSSHGSGNVKTFELPNKKKSFTVNCSYDMDSIISTVKSNVKGLRKEF